jgi:hypothetical protein
MVLFGLPLQAAGPILAVVTFLTIWWGHVLVRIVHYYFGMSPIPVVFVGGALLLFISTQTSSDLLSAALGIVGLTLVWDSFELYRQELRVRQGHAPLNPRVHRVAAGLLAATLAADKPISEEDDLCLSCGSTSTSRFLCRRGPYCRVHEWSKYGSNEALDVNQG